MSTQTIPAIPSTWHQHSAISFGNGYLPHCHCVHEVDYGIHLFAIHLAVVRDDQWDYFQGRYFSTLDEALKAFND